MTILPFCEVKQGLQNGVSTKRKIFIFYLIKRKKKIRADIDVNKTTISVWSQNPYRFSLVKSSISFILIRKHFTTLIFIRSNHASSHFDSNPYYLNRIHPLVSSKSTTIGFKLTIFYIHIKSSMKVFIKQNSSRNLWS